MDIYSEIGDCRKDLKDASAECEASKELLLDTVHFKSVITKFGLTEPALALAPVKNIVVETEAFEMDKSHMDIVVYQEGLGVKIKELGSRFKAALKNKMEALKALNAKYKEVRQHKVKSIQSSVDKIKDKLTKVDPESIATFEDMTFSGLSYTDAIKKIGWCMKIISIVSSLNIVKKNADGYFWLDLKQLNAELAHHPLQEDKYSIMIESTFEGIPKFKFNQPEESSESWIDGKTHKEGKWTVANGRVGIKLFEEAVAFMVDKAGEDALHDLIIRNNHKVEGLPISAGEDTAQWKRSIDLIDQVTGTVVIGQAVLQKFYKELHECLFQFSRIYLKLK